MSPARNPWTLVAEHASRREQIWRREATGELVHVRTVDGQAGATARVKQTVSPSFLAHLRGLVQWTFYESPTDTHQRLGR